MTVRLYWLGLVLLASACANQPGPVEERVRLLGLTELAATFDQEKVSRCLRREPAAASPAQLESLQATALLKCLQHSGQSLLDTELFGQLRDNGSPAWLRDNRQLVADFELRLQRAMAAGLTTGYNVVPENRWPDFDPEKTVIYGHSTWQHARQLVALLHTENLRPKVSVLLKQSAFLYRDDWGPPGRTLPVLDNGQKYIEQLEYDLFIEFEQHADVEKFAQLIDRYAKKDHADESGLIIDAWWQPFYRTFTPFDRGRELTVLLVTWKGYRANLMSIPSLAGEKLQALRELDSQWQVTPVDIWVNPGFYRNQEGKHK